MAPAVKQEVTSEVEPKPFVKREVKVEAKSEVKLEAKLKSETKAEVKRTSKDEKEEKVKPEPATMPKFNDWSAELLRRGLALRAQAEAEEQRRLAVKRERGAKGTASKKKTTKTSKSVKREPGKRTRKCRASAKRRAASSESMKREVCLSPQLAEFVGAPALSRPELVRRIWAKAKSRGLRNPDNGHEILCDAELERLLGEPKVHLMKLSSLLVPHLDYTTAVPAAAKSKLKGCKKDTPATKSEGKKGASVAKSELMGCKKDTHVKRSKEEPCNPIKQQRIGEGRVLTKHEVTAGLKSESMHVGAAGCVDVDLPGYIKRDPVTRMRSQYKPERAPFPGSVTGVKSEGGGARLTKTLGPCISVADDLDVTEVARRVSLRLLGISPTSVRVAFQAPCGTFEYTATAAPAHNTTAAGCFEIPCKTELQESASDGLTVAVAADISGLDPSVAYRINVRIRHSATGEAESTHEVLLMRRAPVSDWKVQQVAEFFASLQAPDLASKASQFAINGTTLLALTQEDLIALGTAPFVARRVLAGLEAFRTI